MINPSLNPPGREGVDSFCTTLVICAFSRENVTLLTYANHSTKDSANFGNVVVVTVSPASSESLDAAANRRHLVRNNQAVLRTLEVV